MSRAGGARPGAGRPKGSKSKATLDIEAKLKRLGCDPIAGMAGIAMAPDTGPDLRARMFAELAQYIAPKRKAVEHTGADGGELTVRILKHAHD